MGPGLASAPLPFAHKPIPGGHSLPQWNDFTTVHHASTAPRLSAPLVLIPLGFLFDTLLIPVICLGAKGVKIHHTAGRPRGSSEVC